MPFHGGTILLFKCLGAALTRPGERTATGNVQGDGSCCLALRLKGQRAGPTESVVSRSGQQGARADREMWAPPRLAAGCNRIRRVSAALARAREEAEQARSGLLPGSLVRG